jgi:hypothetical protein
VAKDLSPKWDNAELMTADQFLKTFRDSMAWYRLERTGKELKPQVINWMSANGYTKEQIAEFKATKDWRSNTTIGGIASCLLKGMPEVHPGFNEGRNTAEWLKSRIAEITQGGNNDVEEEIDDIKAPKIAAPVINIQIRIREQAGTISEELDYAIDAFTKDPEAFDPKAFKIVSLLRGKGAKAAQARYIKGFYEQGHAELLEITNGSTDEQLIEGYSHLSKKNLKKLLDFYEGIKAACEQIAAEAKVMKAPRAKKTKPAEDLIKKLKFLKGDDKLNITSVPPAQLIGAQYAVVYNIRTRKIGYYVSVNTQGFSVKGTSLTNFTDKSTQKTLRKPPEQMKEFKALNTQKRFETWYTKEVKTTETILTGRFNEDTIILKVFK